MDCLEQGEGLILGKVDLEKMQYIRETFPAYRHYQQFVIQELANIAEKTKNENK